MLSHDARRYSQRGITLIESLMALVIISIALLGIASLQLLTLQDVRDARWRASAVNLASGMLEHLRADRDNVDDYRVENSEPGCGSGTTGSCGVLNGWLDEVSASLPSASVNLATLNLPDGMGVSISIRWRQRPAEEDNPLPACGQDADSGGCIRLVTSL